MLQSQGMIEDWHDRRIAAGSVINDAIGAGLDTADCCAGYHPSQCR